VKAVWIALAILLALALQSVTGRFLVRGPAAVDLVLVLVVYVGLTTGMVSGLTVGALAGLAQDALSTGIVGVGGLAKTVVGFLAGAVGTQFIVTQPFPRFVVFFGATAVHAALFMGLYALLDMRQVGNPATAVAGQALGNAVIGVVAFQVIEMLPGAVERRRARRARIRR